MFELSMPTLERFGFGRLARGWRIAQFRAGRLEFYEDFLDSHVELREYCEARAEQLERRDNPTFRVVREIGVQLAQGKSVAGALVEFVPPSDITLLAAHEVKGTLKDGLAQLVESVREEKRLKFQAIRELIWPTLYLATAIALVTYGVPLMVGFLNGSFLNPASMSVDQRALVAFADFMSRYSLVFDVMYAALPTMVFWSLPRWGVTSRVPGRRWLDRHFAFYAIYRSFHSALFIRTLGVQLGVTPKLEEALAAIRLNSNQWLAEYIVLMEERLPHYRVSPIMALDVGLLDESMVDSLFLVSRKGESTHAIVSRAKKAFDKALKTIGVYIGLIRASGILLLGVALSWVTFSLVLQPLRQQMAAMSNPAAMIQQGGEPVSK